MKFAVVITQIMMTALLSAAVCNSATAAPSNSSSSGVSSTAGQMCLVPQAGAPSCGVPAAPGSTPAPPSLPHHVGNPIDVVSGNKYQYELDYRSFASGLTLARHYNSTLTPYNTGIGQGWRHTYQVVISRVSDKQMNIVQSDGRLISFHRLPAGTSSTPEQTRFDALSPEDGYLEVGERTVWHLTDGRRMVFFGSYLVLIDTGDHRGELTLHYDHRKLHTVTDRRGDSLTFNYVPGTSSLPRYGENSISQPPGSLASVTLPNGFSVEYRYDNRGNLLSATYPDADSVGYGYTNEAWPNHMTLRQSTAENRVSEWRYDESGQAIQWIEDGGVNGLSIERVDPAALTLRLKPSVQPDLRNSASSAGAIVTYTDDRQSQYIWQHRDTGSGGESLFDIACDNCIPEFADGAPGLRIDDNTVDEPTFDESAVTDQSDVFSHENSGQNIATLGDAIPPLWSGLQRSTIANQNAAYDVFFSEYPTAQGSLPVQITTSRKADIIDVEIGTVSLLDAGRRTLLQSLPPCFTDATPANPATFSHERLQALGTGNPPCNADGLVYAELVHDLEAYSAADRQITDRLSRLRGRAAGRTQSRPFRRYCNLPAGKSCADLDKDLEMAELSRCAYGNVTCTNAFTLVPFGDKKFGLTKDRFSINGFDAQLYKDSRQDRYILVFRGTDEGSDWADNYDQAMGRKTAQYDLATSLAAEIYGKLKGSKLEIAGHSLGGGLATIAALETETQATIFNAAALQPTTAKAYNLQHRYLLADNYINHIHTHSDPVTQLQAETHDANFYAVQQTPGISTEIPNPDFPWLDAYMKNSSGLTGAFIPSLAWHSMDSVIHVLQSLIAYNCRP